jgi:hypothetical protein
MNIGINRVALVLPPKTGTGGYQRISGSGTTEAHNATALPTGRQAWLQVGAAPIRALWSGVPSLTSQVTATAPIFPAGSRIDWEVESDTRHVYVEGSGTGAYEAWIWPASP